MNCTSTGNYKLRKSSPNRVVKSTMFLFVLFLVFTCAAMVCDGVSTLEGTTNGDRENIKKVSEPNPKLALKDLEEGDIVDLIQKKKIQVETQGSGIQEVSVRLRRLVPYPVVVRIPLGTYFVSVKQSLQNMVTVKETKTTITEDSWVSLSVSAACANIRRDIPGSEDTFTVQRSTHQDELAKLMPVLDRSNLNHATQQAAVWIATDDSTYSDLGTLVSPPTLAAPFATRVIREPEATRAIKICEEAGIAITRKRIWRDRIDILKGLKDDNLKAWFEQKGCSLIGALKETDPYIRTSAAEALAELKDPKGAEPLIATLKDSEWKVRQSAVYALGELKDPRAVEPLIAVLKDSHWDVRRSAARALGKLKDPRAVEPLIAALKDGAVRDLAAHALGKLKDPRAVEPLIAALRDKDSGVRRSAVDALGDFKDPRAVKPLIAVLKDSYWVVRRSAVDALGKLKDPKAVKPLIAVLKDKNSDVRSSAARALGELKDPKAIEPLTAALKDSDSDVRTAASQALDKLRKAKPVEP